MKPLRQVPSVMIVLSHGIGSPSRNRPGRIRTPGSVGEAAQAPAATTAMVARAATRDRFMERSGEGSAMRIDPGQRHCTINGEPSHATGQVAS